MSTRAQHEIRLELPMEPNIEIRAGEAVAELATSSGMERDRVDELRIAVHEACINAAEHSCATDGKIYVTARRVAETGDGTSGQIEVTVRDTGIGVRSVQRRGTMKRRTEPSTGLPRKRGWGLTIIEELVDEFEIDSGTDGTTVTMSKRIGESVDPREASEGA